MEKLAIVGLSCLFPDAETPAQYWQNLLAQKDSRSAATAVQMGVDPQIFYAPNAKTQDKYYCLQGGYIRGFSFDANGYRLPAAAIEDMDDLFKWSLYVAREALQDSGYWGKTAVLNRTGIILGNLSFPTQSSHHLFAPIYKQALEAATRELLQDNPLTLTTLPQNGAVSPDNLKIAGYPAAFVGQAIGLGGANFALDAACASSLYAVKMAGQYLLSGKADLMLAGAVSHADPFFINMGFSIFHAYPEGDATSQPLNQGSDGLYAGEGAGMFVLKRHSDAVRDGDKIYAVISGIGLSNDGKGKFLLQPNPKGQVLAFERAYAQAGIDPADIDYVECHATGTPVGDITELNSMETFFTRANGGQPNSVPLVGSAKSNFGHLLTAAGMAGMSKVILGMAHRQIPATIHLDNPLSSKNGAISSKQMVSQTIPWPQQGNTKRAAISAFGFGGTNAHLILEKESIVNRQSSIVNPTQRVAIVGMDAFFGGCDGLDAFGQTVYYGRQQFTAVPKGRWQGIENEAELLKKYHFADGQAPQGAFISDFELDFFHFKIPPNNDQPIPQQLLILKVADRALQDAGVKEGGNVAVIIAAGAELALHSFRGRVDLTWQIKESVARSDLDLTTEQVARLEQISKDSIHEPAEVNQYISFIGNIMASRISSQWDFSGPAFTLSAEENSTFKALETAQMLLANGEVDAVVVGAVDLAGSVENVLLRHQQTAVNSGTPTLSIDENANGWLIGEGAGVVVLKRYEDAVQAEDRVYAVIDDISIVQGDTLAPSAEKVAQVSQQALANKGIAPTDIGYLELHGSGVAREDVAEIEGITAVYTSPTSTTPTTALGSIKANIGHTFTASGIASLIKTAFCLYHRTIPATPGWTAPKSPERWQESPFYVPTESRPWFKEPGQKQRLAAINGLGADGAYAHLILSEATSQRRPNHTLLQKAPFYLFPVAANDQATLHQRLADLQLLLTDCLDLETAVLQNNIIYQQQQQEKYAIAIVGPDRTKLLREIKMAQSGIGNAFATGQVWKSPQGTIFTPQPLGKTGKIAFVYPGAFSAYPGLGRDIFQLFPHLHKAFADRLPNPSDLVGDKLLYPRTMQPMSDKEAKRHLFKLMSNSVAMLQAGATYSTVISKVLRDQFKVQPDGALGYSLGEMTMMFGTGVWAVADNNSEMVGASPLFRERLSGPQNVVREHWQLPPATPQNRTSIWAIFVLKTAVSAAIAAVEKEARVYLTHINTPNEVVIAGDPQSCQRVVQTLNCDTIPVPYNHVLHCDLMQSEWSEFVKLNTIPVQETASVNFYYAANNAASQLTSEAIAQNIASASCQQVDFPALVQRAYDDGVRLFLELGPRAACSWWIRDILHGQPHLSTAVNRRSLDDHTMLIQLLAQLVSHRVPLDLSSLMNTQAAAVSSQGRSLVRTVSLTKTPIREMMLTAENKAIFAEVALKSRLASVAPPYAHPQSTLDEDVMTRQSTNLEPVLSAPNDDILAVTEETAVNLTFLDDQLQKLAAVMSQSLRVHEAFLNMRQETLLQASTLVEMQIVESGSGINQHNSTPSQSHQEGAQESEIVTKDNALVAKNRLYSERSRGRTILLQDPNRPNNYSKPDHLIWGAAELAEYAGGSIVPMFGAEYAIIDTYRRRVRLPMMPYLLVDRITKLNGKRGVYQPSTMTTEYDIPFDAWYATDGQIPWAVSVESGQCDLLLISYLGIDFANKGERVYRLLDCTLTFLDDMPLEGETLRYDISINSFAQSGDSLLFFFSYNCFVGDKMVLKMRGGCAGFFTDEELAGGKGIITTARQLEEKRQIVKSHFTPPLFCNRTNFNRDELVMLGYGDLAAVFGADYAANGRNPSLRLPPEGVLMIDRIVEVDATGGAWGLGLIVSEKDLRPDDWYFPCHFKDDEVLAGSLVAEGCSQLLQFYLLYLGMQTQMTDARFQPVRDLGQVVRTRKQIMASASKLTYRMEITEIGLEPHPYAKANVDIIYEGVVVVDFKNLGLQLVEKPVGDPYSVNGNQLSVISESSTDHRPPITDHRPPTTDHRPPTTDHRPPTTALFDDYHIQHFAVGSISACFGPDYALFEGRRIPRTPNGDLKLFSRIVEINAERFVFEGEPNLVSEYDVPQAAWFYQQNSYATMPYSVLMEIGLQPCGFLSAYLGSTLSYPEEDFYFRNLDGNGRFHSNIDLRGKTISNRVTLLSATALSGIIIQKFSFEMSVEGALFYEGTAVFGYFQPESLINQVGLDQGRDVKPWFEQEEVSALAINQIVLAERGDLYGETACTELAEVAVSPSDLGRHYRLANQQLNFLDSVTVIPNGGRHGQGYVHAVRTIDPNDWFFSCHFYQDPVMPGSLGVDAIVQAMQIYALDQDLGGHLHNPHFTHVEEHEVVWIYRGQITPGDGQMLLEVDITNIESTPKQVTIRGNASLWKTGMRIYEVKEIAIRLVGEPQESKPLDVVTRGETRAGETAASASSVQAVPQISPQQLGDPEFLKSHGVDFAYTAGAMANGISSEELVIAMGKANLLASFGAAGLVPDRIRAAIQRIQAALPNGPYAFNLIHSPNEENLERSAVDLYLDHQVHTVEASAFLSLTPHIVRYRVAGLSLNTAGQINIQNKVIAKVSRREVAAQFMKPVPAEMLQTLVEQGLITAQQAILAAKVPMADDITVEADSGGHTDNRPLICTLPSIIGLGNELQAEYSYQRPIRIGAAGGISTPQSALAAFMMGAAYVVTGSINQACVEAGASEHTKRLLAQAQITDMTMAPAADMFEMGVELQVLQRGTMFPMRAQKLYDLYQRYDSIEAIPADERHKLETQVFKSSLEDIWAGCVTFFNERDPEQLLRAQGNPKRKMALIFRWYLGLSSRWSNVGEPGRQMDYQIWCGPSMGAFNDWVRGTPLELPQNRRVVDVAQHIMNGAADLYRQHIMRLNGMLG
ncbi:Enoyl-[acyl-carrier-protein] reductase [FMN], inferred for PFA pathway [hydrothermal vent metagenome]|uniref:Enoyl-[acyl-carrier-protein] reductase [FMN], inferred for PFA pathway n=1 Tax=hydrothermal vent metagenome TaxID=652676 RepID=A0A3B0VIJ5_9ZZZZ